MPFDPSGNFTRDYDWVSDKANGIKVRADRMDGEFNNFATGMNQVLLRNGAAPLTGNLNMGTNSIVALNDGSVGTPAIRFNSDTTTGLFVPGVGKIALSASGTNRIEANATGAAITGALAVSGATTFTGAVSLTGALNVAGDATFPTGYVAVGGAVVPGTTADLQVTGDILAKSTGSTALGFNTYYASGAWKQAVAGYAGAIVNDPVTGVLTFHTSPLSVAAAADNNLAERMRIDPTGNVGIGTTSLAARLHVVGNTTIGAQTSIAAVIGRGMGADVYIGSAGGTVPFIGAPGTSPFAFFLNNAEQARITPNGDIGLGTTSPFSISGYRAITIDAATDAALAEFRVGGVDVGRIQALGSQFLVMARGARTLALHTNDIQRMAITPSGDIGIGAVATPVSVAGYGGLSLNGSSGANISGQVAGTERSRITTGASLDIQTFTGIPITFSITGAEAGRFDTNNNFGVGTTSPVNVANYHSVTIAGTTGGILSLLAGATEQARMQASSGGLTLGTTAPTNFSLTTNNVVRVTVGGGGEVYLAASQAPTTSYTVGYLGVPQVGGAAKTANYTAVLADAGQHILFNAAGLTATIPANAAVAYPIGTTLTFVNSFAGNLTIGITTDTMTFAGSALTGNRTLAQNGLATAIKVGATSWLISGPGLT